MGWGDYGKGIKSGSGGKFARLKADGESIQVVIMDGVEPAVRYVEWVDGKAISRSGPKDGDDVKAIYLVAVYDVTEKAPRLLEITTGAFLGLNDMVADPDIGGLRQVYRLRRSGAGKDTRYTWARIREATAAELAAVARELPVDPMEHGQAIPKSGAMPPATMAQQAPADEIGDDVPF
jgi:hypothetical protein